MEIVLYMLVIVLCLYCMVSVHMVRDSIKVYQAALTMKQNEFSRVQLLNTELRHKLNIAHDRLNFIRNKDEQTKL